MRDPVNLFTCWTVRWNAALVFSDDPQPTARLRFTPHIEDGILTPVDLFERWFQSKKSGPPTPIALNHLLRFAPVNDRGPIAPQEQFKLLEAATFLGPLFAVFADQVAMDGQAVEEPLILWAEAARRLERLGKRLEEFPRTSRDTSRNARVRRGEHEAWLANAGFWDFMSPETQRQLIEAHTPSPGISKASSLSQGIGALVGNFWLPRLPGETAETVRFLAPQLRLSEDKAALQIHLPLGIQALAVMALNNGSLGRSLMLRTCACQGCGHVSFMRSNGRYCSPECLQAENERNRKPRQVGTVKRASGKRRTKSKTG